MPKLETVFDVQFQVWEKSFRVFHGETISPVMMVQEGKTLLESMEPVAILVRGIIVNTKIEVKDILEEMLLKI